MVDPFSPKHNVIGKCSIYYFENGCCLIVYLSMEFIFTFLCVSLKFAKINVMLKVKG